MARIDLPTFIESIVDFPETNTSYEILKLLAGIRSCHDAIPAERRILFTCRKLPQTSHSAQQNGSASVEEEFVMKIKIQYLAPFPHSTPSPPTRPNATREPGTPSPDPQLGPSDMTGAELEALEIFTKAGNTYVPRLVTWKRAVQGDNGPLLGGYLIYTIMTKVPGETLFAMQYWTLPETEHEVIRREFLRTLRYVLALASISVKLRCCSSCPVYPYTTSALSTPKYPHFSSPRR